MIYNWKNDPRCEEEYIKYIDYALSLKTEKGFRACIISLRNKIQAYEDEVHNSAPLVDSYQKSSLQLLRNLIGHVETSNIRVDTNKENLSEI